MNQPSQSAPMRRILPRDAAEATDTPGRGGNNWSRNRARAYGADTDADAEQWEREHAETDARLAAEHEARVAAHEAYYRAVLDLVPAESHRSIAQDAEDAIVGALERDWRGTVRTLRRGRWQGL